jgi:hypothetical protein
VAKGYDWLLLIFKISLGLRISFRLGVGVPVRRAPRR